MLLAVSTQNLAEMRYMYLQTRASRFVLFYVASTLGQRLHSKLAPLMHGCVTNASNRLHRTASITIILVFAKDVVYGAASDSNSSTLFLSVSNFLHMSINCFNLFTFQQLRIGNIANQCTQILRPANLTLIDYAEYFLVQKQLSLSNSSRVSR